MKVLHWVCVLCLCLWSSCDLVEQALVEAQQAQEEFDEMQEEDGELVMGSDSLARLKIMSWNLYNFGKSKSYEEILFAAEIAQDMDVLAIQEVSTGSAGEYAVLKMVSILDSITDGFWDYKVSESTTGNGPESYAYVWNTEKVELAGRAWLVKPLEKTIDREPFMARFQPIGSTVSVLCASFHAVPSSKDPEKEVIQLGELDNLYRKDRLLIMGDFNLPQKKDAFQVLRDKGYVPVLVNQKTSLKRKRKQGEYLANEYDNIFFEATTLNMEDADIVDFVPEFRTLPQARKISDHLPVWIEISWR